MTLDVDSDFFTIVELVYRLATDKISYEEFALELGRLVMQVPLSMEVVLYLGGALLTLFLLLRLLNNFRSRFENNGPYALLVGGSAFGTYLVGVGLGNLQMYSIGKYLLIGGIAALMFCLMVRRSRKEFHAGESYRAIPIFCLVALFVAIFMQSGIQWYEVVLFLVLLLFLPELFFGLDAHVIKLTAMFSFLAAGVAVNILHVVLRIATGFGLDVRIAVGVMLVSVPVMLSAGLAAGMGFGLWSVRQPLQEFRPVGAKRAGNNRRAQASGNAPQDDPCRLTFADWERLDSDQKLVCAEVLLEALKNRFAENDFRRSRDHIVYEINAMRQGWREKKGITKPAVDAKVFEQLLLLEGPECR